MSRRRPGLAGPIFRIAAAVAIGVAARDKRIADADEQVRAFVVSRRSAKLDRVMPAVTDLGSTYAIGGAAASLWLLRRKRLASDVAGAGTIAWVAAQAIKPMFHRARPYEVDEGTHILVRTPAGKSYPSGHPAVAAALARVLEPEVAQPARGVVARLPRLVAFSRVYVGVHYPTDVIGGTMLGRAVGDLWLRYARRS